MSDASNGDEYSALDLESRVERVEARLDNFRQSIYLILDILEKLALRTERQGLQETELGLHGWCEACEDEVVEGE